MDYQKIKISTKHGKSKIPRTIKDIDDTLKEMDRIHNTSFYNWIKDENNASVIAFKTKDLFQENYEKQPELVYNALRFLCKDWKLSKIAELILKLFYKCNVASEQLAIIIYEVSLLLENPEKVDLISLLLIGEEAKNVAFFLYHFFQYTEKKYREHTEILKEEEFLDEMNAFCSGILECLYSCLKWNNDYFRELILEYVILSTLEIDARREFLIRMVNVKFSRFQEEIKNQKEDIQLNSLNINNKESSKDDVKINANDKTEETEEVFKKSLNFGILVFNMYQVVMRTEVDELLAVSSPKKEISIDNEIEINNCEDNSVLSDTSMSIYGKKVILKRNDEEGGILTMCNTENNLSNISNEELIKKEESTATLWTDNNDSFENNESNISKDLSSIYNFGYDSSYCKNNNEISISSNLKNEAEESSSDNFNEFSSYHFEELFNVSLNINADEDETDLYDDFINKSFTSSNSNSRRNSTLSFASFISDYNMEESFVKVSTVPTTSSTPSISTTSNNISGNCSSSRRNSRYSLDLSMHSLPCIDNDDRIANTNSCNCNCGCRYNTYSENLFSIFPSPPNSPAITSSTQSPSLLLNDHEFDYNYEKEINSNGNSHSNYVNNNYQYEMGNINDQSYEI